MAGRRYRAIALALLAGCSMNPTREPLEPGHALLIDAAEVVPGLQTDIRYFGSNNFVGTRIDGYEVPKCLLLESVAGALARVEADLRADGKRLLVFDCYRPERAVAHFMRWARDPADIRGKSRWYPNLDKSALVPDYIAERSGHSRGDTLDVTLLECSDVARPATCVAVDMGTEFDLFDVRANTDSDLVTHGQRANRHMLRSAMEQHGFVNYPLEWWHFTLPDPGRATRYFDLPIR